MMRPDTAAQLRAAQKIADKYISAKGAPTLGRDIKDLERAVRVVKAHLPAALAKKYVYTEFQVIVDFLNRNGFNL